MKKSRFGKRRKKKVNFKPGVGICGTYETQEAWVTPMGDFNLIHWGYPTENEIRDRVKEVMSEEHLEDNCPICQMMKEEKGFSILYPCRVWCHDCKKADICKNFNPNSRESEERMMSQLHPGAMVGYLKEKKEHPDAYLPGEIKITLVDWKE